MTSADLIHTNGFGARKAKRYDHGAASNKHQHHTGLQERLVLEEVEVPPRLHGGVAHGTDGLGAVRAQEAAALREIDLDVETMGLFTEAGRLDPPTGGRGRERVAAGRCRA
jgi:hypothetical protein